MSIWEAALLGVIQGLTEFLPISSTAHLVFTRQLLGHPDPSDYFTTAIQLGTLFAVFWYFRRDIAMLVRAVVRDFRLLKFASSVESRIAWLIVLGTVPAGLVGFRTYGPARFRNLKVTAPDGRVLWDGLPDLSR